MYPDMAWPRLWHFGKGVSQQKPGMLWKKQKANMIWGKIVGFGKDLLSQFMWPWKRLWLG